MGINATKEEGFPLPNWSIEKHLEFMEQAGIDYTILSIPTPHIYNGASIFNKDSSFSKIS